MRPALFFAVCLLLTVPMLGCGDDTNVIAPQFEPEVTNLTDAFGFQATDLVNVTQVLVYSWENTGVSANVDQSCSIVEGTATVLVTDSLGTTMYAGSLGDDGSFQTAEGTTGTWTIRVTLTSMDGTLNFSLERRA